MCFIKLNANHLNDLEGGSMTSMTDTDLQKEKTKNENQRFS